MQKAHDKVTMGGIVSDTDSDDVMEDKSQAKPKKKQRVSQVLFLT